MSSGTPDVAHESVYFSGKQAEEIGFQKFSQRQAKLQGIRVLILDHMRIKQASGLPQTERSAIAHICAEITELDAGSNLFENFDDLIELCKLLPKLRVLTLDGNRFNVQVNQNLPTLSTVRHLSLARTLLRADSASKVVSCFPNLESLSFAANELEHLRMSLPASLLSIDLSENDFTSLSDLPRLRASCPTLRTLVLKYNRISAPGSDSSASPSLHDLDLSYNDIESWDFFKDLADKIFASLKHLRVTGNPLYQGLKSAEGKPLTMEDGYMLTVARMPQLETLNYSKITDKERLNAETYYLGQIAVELSNAPEGKDQDVLARHPRYRDLCFEYGEPAFQRKTTKDEVDPSSLAARLVIITFVLAPDLLPDVPERTWMEEVPKSFNIYSILGLVGKRLAIMPLTLSLILETGERDPAAMDSGYKGPEWWDSSDDESDVPGGNRSEWISREVELVASTRPLGTFVECTKARVRVEQRESLG